MKYLLITILILGLVGLARAHQAESSRAKQAWQQIDHGALILDVRTAEEFASGHLDGALNIPHTVVAQHLDEIGTDKEHPIVLYCKSGGRAGRALKTLQSLGYTHLYNGGGLLEMQKAHREAGSE